VNLRVVHPNRHLTGSIPIRKLDSLSANASTSRASTLPTSTVSPTPDLPRTFHRWRKPITAGIDVNFLRGLIGGGVEERAQGDAPASLWPRARLLMLSRPASSGGGVPAPGAKGFKMRIIYRKFYRRIGPVGAELIDPI